MDFGIHFMNFTCDGGAADLARTIADMASATRLTAAMLAEALQYRAYEKRRTGVTAAD